MTTPSNPLLSAAAPSLVNVLSAMQAFIANLGTDPLQVAAKFPGAAQVFLGTVELQGPALASAEFGAAQAKVNAQIAAWIASLQGTAPGTPAHG